MKPDRTTLIKTQKWALDQITTRLPWSRFERRTGETTEILVRPADWQMLCDEREVIHPRVRSSPFVAKRPFLAPTLVVTVDWLRLQPTSIIPGFRDKWAVSKHFFFFFVLATLKEDPLFAFIFPLSLSLHYSSASYIYPYSHPSLLFVLQKSPFISSILKSTFPFFLPRYQQLTASPFLHILPRLTEHTKQRERVDPAHLLFFLFP